MSSYAACCLMHFIRHTRDECGDTSYPLSVNTRKMNHHEYLQLKRLKYVVVLWVLPPKSLEEMVWVYVLKKGWEEERDFTADKLSHSLAGLIIIWFWIHKFKKKLNGLIKINPVKCITVIITLLLTIFGRNKDRQSLELELEVGTPWTSVVRYPQVYIKKWMGIINWVLFNLLKDYKTYSLSSALLVYTHYTSTQLQIILSNFSEPKQDSITQRSFT